MKNLQQMPVPPDSLENLKRKLSELCWIAYAPTNFNPDKRLYPSTVDIRQDLQFLYNMGFKGLVTYGADNILAEVPRLAKEVGFEGVIMGIWDPSNIIENNNAIKAVTYVDGYTVGNEGFNAPQHNPTYDYDILKDAIDKLRKATKKPVATTEEIDDYYADPRLVELGDWIFPNVHPYWHGIKEPEAAVAWTVEQYNRLAKHNKFVSLKEVGFPTEGDTEVSEERQAEYYQQLQETGVKFIHFEAFDGPWKTWEPVEPHWGLFRNDRSVKKVVGPFCK
jgi:exo-beta-1,3-glucanase (GH17 family)